MSNSTTVRIDLSANSLLNQYCKETRLKKATALQLAIEDYVKKNDPDLYRKSAS